MLTGLIEDLARRRLVGVALLLAGAAIAAAILTGRGGDEEERAATAAAPAVRTVRVPDLGLAFSHPATWRQEVDGRVFRLRSPDDAVLVTISSPVAGQRTQQVEDRLEQALRRRLAPARRLREGPARLGGGAATSFELAGRSADGPVRALGVVADTPYRTYAVTVLTAAAPSAGRLREVQAVLAGIRLSAPS